MLEDQLIKAILNSWNFCGDQREAARQVFDDYGVSFSEEIYFEAIEEADKIWKLQSNRR